MSKQENVQENNVSGLLLRTAVVFWGLQSSKKFEEIDFNFLNGKNNAYFGKNGILLDGQVFNDIVEKLTNSSSNFNEIYRFVPFFQHSGAIWWWWQQYIGSTVFPTAAHIQAGPFPTSTQASVTRYDPYNGQRNDFSGSINSLHFHGQYTGYESFRRQVHVPGWRWGKKRSSRKFWWPFLGAGDCVSGKSFYNQSTVILRPKALLTQKQIECYVFRSHLLRFEIFVQFCFQLFLCMLTRVVIIHKKNTPSQTKAILCIPRKNV